MKGRESWTSLSDKLMLPNAFEVSQLYFAPKCWSNTLVFNCWSLMIHYTPQFQIKLFSFSFLLPNSVHQRCFINEPERCRCTLNAKMLFDSFSWRLRLHIYYVGLLNNDRTTRVIIHYLSIWFNSSSSAAAEHYSTAGATVLQCSALL